MDQPRIARNVPVTALVVVLAAVVGVLALAGVAKAILSQRITMDAGSAHTPALPENVYRPTRYLAGVVDAGPPGRLAVIAEKIQGEESYGPWFGISATTGEYRFLDLPEMAEDARMRLSPDGRRIAYWMGGHTQGAINGIAIYNTADGSVVRNPIPSEHGLAMDDLDGGMYWLNDQNLAFVYQEAAGDDAFGAAAEGGGTFLWTSVDAEPAKTVRLGQAGDRAVSFRPAYPPTTFVRDNHFDFPVEVDERGRATGRIAKVLPVGDGLTWSSSRLVRIGGNDSPSGHLPQVEVGRAAGASLVKFSAIPGFRSQELLGWRDADTVLVEGGPDDGTDSEGPYGLYAINVDDQTFRYIGTSEGFNTQFAISLLGEPTVQGREPPSAWQLLLTYRALAIGSGVLGVAALVLLRRRGKRLATVAP